VRAGSGKRCAHATRRPTVQLVENPPARLVFSLLWRERPQFVTVLFGGTELFGGVQGSCIARSVRNANRTVVFCRLMVGMRGRDG